MIFSIILSAAIKYRLVSICPWIYIDDKCVTAAKKATNVAFLARENY
jgi:hypothetical protein